MSRDHFRRSISRHTNLEVSALSPPCNDNTTEELVGTLKVDYLYEGGGNILTCYQHCTAFSSVLEMCSQDRFKHVIV